MRYFAMELIDGESLDKVMSRRGRMTWEEVVELGKQLCSALQHAHEKGIIHRDLKPSNIMVLHDGTLKLTDFGIAKVADLEALTATNCTVGTASYMSPEQCKGQTDLTAKSDLYSLGVLFYELVTGRKPFKAESAMDMFMQHVNGTFERPSRLVLDIPVWLDTLICQLLEKKPEQRPLDAHMVVNTLNTIQEKFEAQQSAGVEAVRKRLIDRTPGQKRLGEEDKDAARLLLTGKARAKRKRVKKLVYKQVWFQAIGLVLAFGFVATLLYLVFRPPSADKLYRQAKAVMESGDIDRQESAIDPGGVIDRYLQTPEGKQDSKQSREVRSWRKQIRVAEGERRLDKHMQQERENKRVFIKLEPEGQTQKDAFAAVDAEDKGDKETALARWQTVKEREGADSPWAKIADKHLAEWYEAERISEQQFPQKYEHIQTSGEEPPRTDDLESEAFLAWRMERSEVGDFGLAKTLFQSLLEKMEKEPGMRRRWYLFAAWQRRELARKLENETDEKKSLKERVQKYLNDVHGEWKKHQFSNRDAKLVCLDVLALYRENESMSELVKAAKGFIKEISK
jgi:serine/threonine-protein kinase